MIIFVQQTWWDSFLAAVQVPPDSLWFILLISFVVAMSSTILNKLLTDTVQLTRVSKR